MRTLGATIAAGGLATLVMGLGMGGAGMGALPGAAWAQTSPLQRPGAGQAAPQLQDAPRRAEPRTDQRKAAPKPEVEVEQDPGAIEGCPFRERKLELIV